MRSAKTRSHVHGGPKNDICKRTQITPQGIYFHYGFSWFKNISAKNYGCHGFNQFPKIDPQSRNLQPFSAEWQSVPLSVPEPMARTSWSSFVSHVVVGTPVLHPRTVPEPVARTPWSSFDCVTNAVDTGCWPRAGNRVCSLSEVTP